MKWEGAAQSTPSNETHRHFTTAAMAASMAPRPSRTHTLTSAPTEPRTVQGTYLGQSTAIVALFGFGDLTRRSEEIAEVLFFVFLVVRERRLRRNRFRGASHVLCSGRERGTRGMTPKPGQLGHFRCPKPRQAVQLKALPGVGPPARAFRVAFRSGSSMSRYPAEPEFREQPVSRRREWRYLVVRVSRERRLSTRNTPKRRGTSPIFQDGARMGC